MKSSKKDFYVILGVILLLGLIGIVTIPLLKGSNYRNKFDPEFLEADFNQKKQQEKDNLAERIKNEYSKSENFATYEERSLQNKIIDNNPSLDETSDLKYLSRHEIINRYKIAQETIAKEEILSQQRIKRLEELKNENLAGLQRLELKEKIQLERNAADIENSTRLTIAQIVGGVALLLGLWLTYQNVKTAQDNLRVTEEGKLTERFSKAVELLGNEKSDIRIGGIYALERIARDSQKDHWTVIEVLTSFIRQIVPYNPDKKCNSQKETKLCEDIQAIITVIGRRKWTKTELQTINLRKVALRKYDLDKANLSKANLSEANLSEADLSEADLSVTDLRSSVFKNSILRKAKLFRANLSFANLSGADLSNANLSNADLSNATLSNADLSNADMQYTENITLKQILSAKDFEKAILPPKLKEELKKWQAKQAKKIKGAGEDSSENQAEE